MEFIKLHPAAKDISGQRYGRLLALGPSHVKKFPSGANHVQWLCRCDCGAEKVISIAKLTTGNTRSCGCLQQESRLACIGTPTHGRHGTPEYEAWHSMLQRCQNPAAQNYRQYGGRGIGVFEEWQDFDAFFRYVGLRPSQHHSLDRYPDNDGNYEPGNVRWATGSEQQRNRRNNYLVTAFGRTEPLVCFVENERHFNLARSRIARGWDAERAISEPRGLCGPKGKPWPASSFWRPRG